MWPIVTGSTPCEGRQKRGQRVPKTATIVLEMSTVLENRCWCAAPSKVGAPRLARSGIAPPSSLLGNYKAHVSSLDSALPASHSFCRRANFTLASLSPSRLALTACRAAALYSVHQSPLLRRPNYNLGPPSILPRSTPLK